MLLSVAKNLDDIKDVPEILRFALDDKMMWNFYFEHHEVFELSQKKEWMCFSAHPHLFILLPDKGIV